MNLRARVLSLLEQQQRGDDSVRGELSGHRLPLDVNVAAVRDPSHQYIGTD